MIQNQPTKSKSDHAKSPTATLDSPLIDRLIQEYKSILKHELYKNGIYIIPINTTRMRTGYYKTGKFKAELYIPEDYPQKAVKVYFKTRIYHPLINYDSGELDTKMFMRSSSNRIELLALFMKSIFSDSSGKYLSITGSFNPEAGKAFQENLVGFNKKVQESIHLAGADQNNYLTRMEEDDQMNLKDIREVISTLVKCTGELQDKVDVLIDNTKKIVMSDF